MTFERRQLGHELAVSAHICNKRIDHSRRIVKSTACCRCMCEETEQTSIETQKLRRVPTMVLRATDVAMKYAASGGHGEFGLHFQGSQSRYCVRLYTAAVVIKRGNIQSRSVVGNSVFLLSLV